MLTNNTAPAINSMAIPRATTSAVVAPGRVTALANSIATLFRKVTTFSCMRSAVAGEVNLTLAQPDKEAVKIDFTNAHSWSINPTPGERAIVLRLLKDPNSAIWSGGHDYLISARGIHPLPQDRQGNPLATYTQDINRDSPLVKKGRSIGYYQEDKAIFGRPDYARYHVAVKTLYPSYALETAANRAEVFNTFALIGAGNPEIVRVKEIIIEKLGHITIVMEEVSNVGRTNKALDENLYFPKSRMHLSDRNPYNNGFCHERGSVHFDLESAGGNPINAADRQSALLAELESVFKQKGLGSSS